MGLPDDQGAEAADLRGREEANPAVAAVAAAVAGGEGGLVTAEELPEGRSLLRGLGPGNHYKYIYLFTSKMI